MWVVCGPVPFNADVIMKAQAALLLKASDDHAATLRTAALELADAEALATAPKERRGEKADSTVSGADLEAAVKFVHLKAGITGWSAFNTKPKRVAYLAALVPAWTERVLCAGVAVPPIAAAPPPPPPPPLWLLPLPHPRHSPLDLTSMSAAERRANLAALTAAMQQDE